jgi:hypothetical protein
VTDSAYANYLYAGTPRPNVKTNAWYTSAVDGSFDPDKSLMLDASAFSRRTNPAADPFGNAPRLSGAARSWPIIRENTSVTRAFTIREGLRGEFRWESYNLFNHHTWSNPVLELSNTQFGKVTNAFGNRTMQMGVKVIW